MIRRFAWALVILLLSSAPAAAQRWPDEQCVANPNLAPCAQSRADGLAETYGVRRIEAHRDAGDEVLRIFFIKDGDRGLISFVRAPGRDPMVYVHFPRVRGGPAPAPMQAPVPQALWSEVSYRAAYADRRLVPVPPDPEVETICLHPWNYVFEASESADPIYGRSARMRRHSVDSCDDAPLLYFAADFQRLVIPLFPACDALEARLFGNAVQRFSQCRRLSGDRLAAAGVMNLAHAFQGVRGPEDLQDLQELIDSQATIDWNGRRRGPQDRNPAAFWLARVAEDHAYDFWIEAAEGVSADRIRLTGRLLRDRLERNDGAQSEARLEQIWARTLAGIRVTSVTVGPWQDRPD